MKYSIFLIGLLLRILWASYCSIIDPVLLKNPLHGDAAGYHLLASNLLQGNGLSWDGEAPTSYRMPGYPAFLAVIYALTGENLTIVRLIQAVLGALTVFPVYGIARYLGGNLVALIAMLGIAIHPLMIYMTGWIYSETLFILLLWVGMWFLAKTLIGQRLPQAIYSGGFLGLATFIRPEIAFFPIAVVLCGIILRWSRSALKFIFVIQITLLLIVSPWSIRNTLVNKAFVPLTTSAGSNFYAGNNLRSNGGSFWEYPLQGLSELESDRELQRRAWSWITDNPGEALRNMLRKLFKFFSPIEFETTGSTFGKWGQLFYFVYAGFLTLAAWGARLNWRTEIGTLLIALVGWYLMTALIFFGGSRVALPIAPCLVIFAVCGFIQVLAGLKRRLKEAWTRF